MANFQGYFAKLSTSGIWHQYEFGGRGRFFYLCTYDNHVPGSHPDIPAHTTDSLTLICSSSRSLFLCRDSMSNYIVCNPFIQEINASYIRLPSLRRPHPPNTPAVITIDIENPLAPIFHVICAVREGPDGFYTFDTYSSNDPVWRYHEGINLQRCDLKLTSGVSCGRIAYWLTRIPLLVVSYDIRDNAATFLSLTEAVPQEVLWSQTTRLQLGRVGNKLGLVVVDEAHSRVELHVLRGINDWESACVLNVELQEDSVLGISMADLWDRGDILICREMPRPIRLESFKMEVLLWVDGEVILWTSSTTDPGKRRLQRTSGSINAHVANGIAHVCASFVPWSFFRNQPE